jgi:hypothetical protein
MYALRIFDGETMVVMNGYNEVERVRYDADRYAALNGNRDPIPFEIAKFLGIWNPADPWPEINTDKYVFLIADDSIAVFKKPHVNSKKNIDTIASADEQKKFIDRHFRLHPKTYSMRALDIFCLYFAHNCESKTQLDVTWPDLVATGPEFFVDISRLAIDDAYMHQIPMHELVEELNAGHEYPDCIDFSDLLHVELLPFVCHTTHRRMSKQDVFRAAHHLGYILRPPYIEHREYILREVHFMTRKTLQVYRDLVRPSWAEAKPLLTAAYGNAALWAKLDHALYFK